MDEIEGNDVETSGSDNSSSRAASRARSTKETSIDVALDLDKNGGTNGSVEISTGIETLDGLFDALAETAEFARSNAWRREIRGSTTTTRLKTSPSPSASVFERSVGEQSWM